LIEAFLYGVSAFDPITMGLTVLVLGIASLVALSVTSGEGNPDQPNESAERVIRIKGLLTFKSAD